MRFSRLLAEALPASARPADDAEVRRVTIDSRGVREGDCFVAVRGTATDGHRFIAPAVAAGCAAVVCENATAVPPNIPCAVVPDTRAAAGPLAQAIRDWPGRKLTTVGVTGTNGKTTFTYILRHILQRAGHRAALAGTICYDTLDRSTPARNTTPDAVQLADMMADAVAAGATHMIMEVSSHALDQHRTDGIDFNVAVFTNLTGDHLDYHVDMANYFAAKRRLFASLAGGAVAVLNRDDPYGQDVFEAVAEPVRVLWYGLSAAADVFGRIERLEARSSTFELVHAGREVSVRTPLVGRHNVYNCLAAGSAAIALGADVADVADALADVPYVPGRLQRVGAEAPFDVLVDYAHTDDALQNVLSALRPVVGGQLILMFGCGGDRDRTKRPRMAAVAEQWADRVVVTSDNPRTEDPQAIIDEILAGLTDRGRAKATVEPDRRDAIAAALEMAGAGDAVLIAGKGHENYQVVGARRIYFDDVQVAADLLRRRGF